MHEVHAVDLPSWEPAVVVDLAELSQAPEPSQAVPAPPLVGSAPQQALSEEELALLDEELALEEQAQAARLASSRPVAPSPAVPRSASVGELPRVDLVPSVTMPADEMTTYPSSDAAAGGQDAAAGHPAAGAAAGGPGPGRPAAEERQELSRRINRLLDQMVRRGGLAARGRLVPPPHRERPAGGTGG